MSNQNEKLYFERFTGHQIILFITECLKKEPSTTNTDIAKTFIDKFGVDRSVRTVREVISTFRPNDNKNPVVKNASTEEITVIVEEKIPYQVIGNDYYFESKNGRVVFPVELIDQLFYEYSEHGLNLTENEIIRKHDLKPWEWHSIKSKLMLYKKSHVFSPHTMDNTEPADLTKMIAEKMEKAVNNIGLQVEKLYDKKLYDKYKQTISVSEEKNLILQTMLLEFADKLPEIKIEKFTPPAVINPQGTTKISDLNLFIADPHFGADNFDIKTPNYVKKYNPEVTKELFAKIAATVNTYNAERVHVWFLGDNIHCYSGFNHPGSWKGMTPGLYGAELLIEAYKVFGSFLNSVNNLSNIYAVPGNHDRAAAKWFEDQGSVSKLLFEFLGLSLRNTGVKIKYDDKIISESIDGIQYLMGHGHLKLFSKHPEQLVRNFGDPYKFNLIVTAHLHTRMMNFDSPYTRKLTLPAIFMGDEYAKDSGFFSTQGFTIAYNDGNSNGVPTVVDHPL